jgi:hypothetical protein
MVVNESGKRYISDIIDEWLDTYDEYEEEESIFKEIQPYRQRFENTKVSDENDP